MNQKLFNIETGEEVSVPGVDAREYLATGGWSTDPPVPFSSPAAEPIKKIRKSKDQETVE